MQVKGACANHPTKPGAWLMEDGTWRCDPCLYRQQGRKEAAEAVWARAQTLRHNDFPAGKVGIEYVNGFEDAAHVADPD